MPKNKGLYTYKVVVSDPAVGWIEGMEVVPYYHDTDELIFINPASSSTAHHVKVNGEYMKLHLKNIAD